MEPGTHAVRKKTPEPAGETATPGAGPGALAENPARADTCRAQGPLAPDADRAQLTQAVAALPCLLRQVADHPHHPHHPDRYGLQMLTVLWLEADKSDHTRRAYYADLAAWLGWCERTGLDPLSARRADVDAWKATLVVTDRNGVVRSAAAATVARRLAAVSSWYRYLVSNEVAARNPIDVVRRPRTSDLPPLPALDETSTVRLLTHAEQRARRNATEASWRDAAIVSLLFHTGLRVGAVTGADVADLDRDGAHVVLRYRKKGGTRDLVPLAPPVLIPLQEYLALRAGRRSSTPVGLSGPLFATVPRPGLPSCPGESRLTQRDVWRTLRTLARQAGLPQADTITPHTARRTAGTLLLAHGVPVQKVSDLLGHRDIRTTRDRYDAHRHKLDSSPAYLLADLLANRQGDSSGDGLGRPDPGADRAGPGTRGRG
jgi:integrase/recombinase XerD